MKTCRNNSLTNQCPRKLPLIALLAIAGVVQPAIAVDRVWFGDFGEWNTASNWSGPIAVWTWPDGCDGSPPTGFLHLEIH